MLEVNACEQFSCDLLVCQRHCRPNLFSCQQSDQKIPHHAPHHYCPHPFSVPGQRGGLASFAFENHRSRTAMSVDWTNWTPWHQTRRTLLFFYDDNNGVIFLELVSQFQGDDCGSLAFFMWDMLTNNSLSHKSILETWRTLCYSLSYDTTYHQVEVTKCPAFGDMIETVKGW